MLEPLMIHQHFSYRFITIIRYHKDNNEWLASTGQSVRAIVELGSIKKLT